MEKRGDIPISKPAKIAIKEKHKKHKLWISSLNAENKEQHRITYTKARNKVKQLLRKEKRAYERDIAQKSKISPKTFWSHTRRKLKTRSGIAPLLADVKNKESIEFDDTAKANILQRGIFLAFLSE